MIEIINVVKKYSQITALNNVYATIKKSEIVGLLGPNGAGKSTLMKIIAGFLIPDQGEIKINSQDLKENEITLKKRIGYMPENNPLYKEMLVFEALNFSMQINGIKKNETNSRIDKVVSEVGLEEVYYRPIAELSKGYKQRVGLAQALIHNPDILVLDEPTEGLDPNQRAEIRSLIKSLGKDKTVIISTHVMQEVEAMCSRIILINKGEIIKDDSKENFGKIKQSKLQFDISVNFLQKNSKEIFEQEAKKYKIKILPKNKAKISNLTINSNSKDNVIKFLNTMIRQEKIELHEMAEHKQNLEEIFKKLTVK